MERILIIDDDMDMCNLLSRFLQKKGYETEASHSGNKGIAKFKESKFDVVLCDFRLGDKEGREVLKEIKNIDPYAIVIIITGYSDIKTAVDVIKAGAFDYITKPLIPEEVLNVIGRALQQSADGNIDTPRPAAAANGQVTNKKSWKTGYEEKFLVGQAPATRELYRQIELVAGVKEMETDVRIIVASNENLQDAYRKGRFREDLFHRFNEFSIVLPAFRQRKEDIPLFADFFLDKANQELNKEVAGFEPEVMQILMNYAWPGTSREFLNVIRRAALLTSAGLVNSRVLPAEIVDTNSYTYLQQQQEAQLTAPSIITTSSHHPITHKETDLKNAAAQ